MVVPEFAGLSDGGRGDVDEMEEQRLKNNMAVKRSRLKRRQKMSQMVDRWVLVEIPPSQWQRGAVRTLVTDRAVMGGVCPALRVCRLVD